MATDFGEDHGFFEKDGRGMLDEASKERVKYLCDLIAKEQDHQRFSKLIAELNDLLDGSDHRPADANESPSH